MTLYEINQEIERVIQENIDLETGEILNPEQLNEQLSELNIAKESKRENIAIFIKNLTVDKKAIDEEIKTLRARKKAKENKIENLKQYLAMDLLNSGLSKFETPKVALSFRTSKALEIDSTDNIPDEYFIDVEPIVDKVRLKKDIQSGLECDGVRIVKKQNLQIK